MAALTAVESKQECNVRPGRREKKNTPKKPKETWKCGSKVPNRRKARNNVTAFTGRLTCFPVTPCLVCVCVWQVNPTDQRNARRGKEHGQFSTCWTAKGVFWTEKWWYDKKEPRWEVHILYEVSVLLLESSLFCDYSPHVNTNVCTFYILLCQNRFYICHGVVSRETTDSWTKTVEQHSPRQTIQYSQGYVVFILCKDLLIWLRSWNRLANSDVCIILPPGGQDSRIRRTSAMPV